mmetsp:Transcript_8228/g.15064  ORF Transcript_8228/g.15064 Transcript_8228/m.15064 type:complete len:410 (-) Transcript_8228:1611-2840(-)
MNFSFTGGLIGGPGAAASNPVPVDGPASPWSYFLSSSASRPPLSTPGLFTEEDEENERRSATLVEIAGSRADFYGAVTIRDRPAEEIRTALSDMNDALRRIPSSKRRRYDEAQEKCPDQVSDNRKVAFLWRTDFDAELSAQRLAEYWEFKHSIFGDEKCYLPMTLSGALTDDVGTLSAGILQLFPVKDLFGRSMVFFNPAQRDLDKHSRNSVLRAIWYIYHVALEDPDVQKRGIVFMAYVEKASPKHFDIHLYPTILDLEKKYVPIRIRAFHICHPDPFFRATLPIAKFILGRRIRSRTGIHSGTEQAVLEKLVDFGIPPDRVPTDMGGVLVLDVCKWLCDRLSLEKARASAEEEESKRRRSSSAEDQSPNAGVLAMALKIYQESLNEDRERSAKRQREVEGEWIRIQL